MNFYAISAVTGLHEINLGEGKRWKEVGVEFINKLFPLTRLGEWCLNYYIRRRILLLLFRRGKR